jgi:hypothetical protein
MSARLVLHSFRLLFRNFAQALRVSVAPLILATLLSIAAFTVSGVTPAMIAMASFTGRLPPNGLLAILFIGVVMLFTFSWIAVAWHRFVLLEEYPGFVPPVTDRPIWPYVWRTLGLGLLIFMVMTFLSIIVGMILPLTGQGAVGAVAMIIGTVLTYVWLRSALILPAVAVGEELKLRDAWSVSARGSRAIFGVSLILVGLNLMVGIGQQTLVPPGAFAVIVSLVVGWITLMVGTSILTTLYGYLVQNRPLP